MRDSPLSTSHPEVARPHLTPGRLAMVGSALGLAALSQALIDKRDSLGVMLVAYVAAAVLFALATHTLSLRWNELSTGGSVRPPMRKGAADLMDCAQTLGPEVASP